MSSDASKVHLIELQQVTKLYTTAGASFTALDRVDLTLPARALSAIVGRSGSGKSTLMNLIAGLDRPTSGRVCVAGTDVHQSTETELARWRGRNVGVVFQFFQLLPTLTVAENVMLPMDLCGSYFGEGARQRALALLERVGIPEQADKLPLSLSGGQQQRAAIARALANDPAVIVADEPTGNLDSRTAAAVLELFWELSRAGKCVLVVTHDREVASVADRVIELADGRVVSASRSAGRSVESVA
ncbi:MAG: ABC transporter ATP-binding protein [Myxococcota bacterium]